MNQLSQQDFEQAQQEECGSFAMVALLSATTAVASVVVLTWLLVKVM